MKSTIKVLALSAFIFVNLSGSLNAQEQYTIKTIMKVDGLPPEYAAMGEQQITTYIKGEKQKSEMTGMMGSNMFLFDGKKMTRLMDQMGQKKGFIATKEELEADDKGKEKANPTIEYINETRTIAGYECKKAIITNIDKDKKANKTTVWYTDKIHADQTHSRKASRGMVDLGDLKGYPLAMEMTQMAQGKETKLTITATEVLTTPIDDSVFVANTEGYQMMSYKEFKELQKANMMGR